MKYRIHTGHYKDFKFFEENKELPRAYFVPHSCEKALKSTDFRNERYKSDRVILLSGQWQFKYYSKIFAVPKVFDTEFESFEDISVPST